MFISIHSWPSSNLIQIAEFEHSKMNSPPPKEHLHTLFNSSQNSLSFREFQLSMEKLETIRRQSTLIRPCEERKTYLQLETWIRQRLKCIGQTITEENISQEQLLKEEQKVVFSGFLEMIELCGKECAEKGNVLRILMETTFSMLSTLIKTCEESRLQYIEECRRKFSEEQKASFEKVERLEVENVELRKEKNHKWRNVFMVVKDNRVLRKQKAKLEKVLREEQWKVKLINEELSSLKKENESFRLLVSDYPSDGERIAAYVNSKVIIDALDRQIQSYPRRVKRLVLEQLRKIETHEFNTLEQKLAYILNVIENEGEMVDDLDEVGDFLDAKRMCFNIHTQTQTLMREVQTNTPSVLTDHAATQSDIGLLSQKLELDSLTVCERVRGLGNLQKRSQRKGKTITISPKEHAAISRSNKKIGSIKRLLLEDYDLSAGFQLTEAFEMKIFPSEPMPHSRLEVKSPQQEKLTDPRLQESQDNYSIANISNISESRVAQEETGKQKGERPSQSKKVGSRSVNKRASRVENMHTFSSKIKVKDVRVIQSASWKVRRVFGVTVQKDTPRDQQLEKRASICDEVRRSKVAARLPSFKSKNLVSGNLRKFLWERDEIVESESSSVDLAEEAKLATKRNISQIHSPIPIGGAYQHGPDAGGPQESESVQRRPTDQLQQISAKISHSGENTDICGWSTKHDKRVSKASMDSCVLNSNQKRLFTEQSPGRRIKQGVSKESVTKKGQNARKSQLLPSQGLISLQGLRKHKLRQVSFLSPGSQGGFKSPPANIPTKRSSEMLHPFPRNQRFQKHLRTRTQGIEEVEEGFDDDVSGSCRRNSQEAHMHKRTHSQSKRLNTESCLLKGLTPPLAVKVENVKDLQTLDSKLRNAQELGVTFDLTKHVDKIVKGIAQRGSEIIKKEYLFKEFLNSFYQQQYGGGQNLKLYTSMVKEIKSSRSQKQSGLSAMSVLMNELHPESYRKDIFKVFTFMVEKNGGLLSNSQGRHEHTQKVFSDTFSVFMSPESVRETLEALCLQSLDGDLADYFIAGQLRLRKSSLQTEFYSFCAAELLSESETTVPYGLLKEMSYFLLSRSNQIQKSLMELRLYMSDSIEVHRVSLLIEKIGCWEILNIRSSVEKAYCQTCESRGCCPTEKGLTDYVLKQDLAQFPVLKSVLRRQVDAFYRHNRKISRTLLELCYVTAFEYRISTESELLENLESLRSQYGKLQRLTFYQSLSRQEKMAC